MTWQDIGLAAAAHIKAVLAGIGFTGGGVGLVKFLKHAPAPYQDQPWAGAVFDTLQDLVSNSRIGERRTRAGVVVPVEEPKPVPQPVAAPVEPTSTTS